MKRRRSSRRYIRGRVKASPVGLKLTDDQRATLFAIVDLWGEGNRKPSTAEVGQKSGLEEYTTRQALCSMAFMSPYLVKQAWQQGYWYLQQEGQDLAKHLREKDEAHTSESSEGKADQP